MTACRHVHALLQRSLADLRGSSIFHKTQPRHPVLGGGQKFGASALLSWQRRTLTDRLCAGVAISSNGIDWQRGHGAIEGARGEAKALDVGRVLEPNEEDWWWLDTRHMAVSDVQVSMCFHFACWTPSASVSIHSLSQLACTGCSTGVLE